MPVVPGPLYEQYCGLNMNNEQLAALLEPQKRVSAVDFDSVRSMWDFLTMRRRLLTT